MEGSPVVWFSSLALASNALVSSQERVLRIRQPALGICALLAAL